MAFANIGSNRELLRDLAATERQRLIAQQVLVGDPRRWRPRWFDGRFLAASDLLAEQNYFLTRQADAGRALGTGVIDGLMVRQAVDEATGAGRLRIEAGQGITDTGEIIVLLDALTVDPANVPETRRLDAAFGLQVIPNEPPPNRTGLYVLALRPVEWTDTPIGAYPTSLTGSRTVEDANIVEGVAVSLIPYPDLGNDETWNRRRARAAREIFVEGKDNGFASGVLPLAMVALRGNLTEWLDVFLVRRETGSERPAGIDFGFGARPLREAHLLQYQAHLAESLDTNQDQGFPATSYLDALPPVGQFPASTVDPDRLTQTFFPAGIEVELSFLPEDELPAVIEETLLSPPIDLTTAAESLKGLTVVVLIPLTRAEFDANRASLPDFDAAPPRLRPPAPGILTLSRATPRELLLSRVFRPILPPVPPPPEDLPWRELLRAALNRRLLWYVRRRHLPTVSNFAGMAVRADNPLNSDPRILFDLISNNPELRRGFNRIRSLNAPAVSLLTSRLSERRFVDNPALLTGIVRAAENAPDAEGALVALAPVTDPRLGEGLNRITTTPEMANELRRDDVVVALPEVDRIAREVPQERLGEFTDALREAVQPGGNVAERLTGLRERFRAPQ